jgi:assimilatory nitrate reductase catalytic subunit
MAAEPPLTTELLATFGPLKSYAAGQRLDSAVDPDRLVKTHCCFCGQQCGIQLKVKDNQVIGFEPWEDFPFNRGMLCPKGVRRYLQGSHHDRLTSAYLRDESLPAGFRPAPYDDAIGRVAAEIERIQSKYGPDAFDSPAFASRPDTSTTTGACAWCLPPPATRRRLASTGPAIR